MNGVLVVAAYTLRESVRRRVVVVVGTLTLAFLALYGWGASLAFDSVRAFSGRDDLIDAKVLTGSTMLGLAMFTTLFLGAVLAVFLTLSAVRGDAERGLLQPLVVRPLGRSQLLAGRFAAAATFCAGYVTVVYAAATVLTGLAGGWWPDRAVAPWAGLVAGVVTIAVISLLGSVFLSATANGIAVFMVFGAGLAAGLLGQVGEALGSGSLQDAARVASWVLPFEALYQAGLHGLTADAVDFTRTAVRLGPFGGAAAAGPLLWPWALGYLAGVGALTAWAFARRDL